MAETLTGTIDKMSLLEIIKLLNSGKMTGYLKVNNSYGKGELYVKSGQIVHCIAGTSIGEAAVTKMLSWIEGSFSFEADIEAPEESVVTSTKQLLLDCARKIEDWQKIKQVISSMNVTFKLSTSGSTSAINLQPDEWQVLAQVNGNRTVGQIIENTGSDEFNIARILFQLYTIGLLEIVPENARPAGPTVDVKFIDKIESELKKIIGPLAAVVVEEAIEGFGANRNAFPHAKIASLIETLCSEISDENKKIHFSQIMIDQLKNY
jgi:hypothetical protein